MPPSPNVLPKTFQFWYHALVGGGFSAAEYILYCNWNFQGVKLFRQPRIWGSVDGLEATQRHWEGIKHYLTILRKYPLVEGSGRDTGSLQTLLMISPWRIWDLPSMYVYIIYIYIYTRMYNIYIYISLYIIIFPPSLKRLKRVVGNERGWASKLHETEGNHLHLPLNLLLQRPVWWCHGWYFLQIHPDETCRTTSIETDRTLLACHVWWKKEETRPYHALTLLH